MLRRLTALCTGILAWFADAGLSPRTRIERNHNAAGKSLPAAGDGAAVLPLAHAGEQLHPGVQVVPFKPPEAVDGATRNLRLALAQFRRACRGSVGGCGLENNFAAGHMHHADLLAGRVGQAFDCHGHGQRAVSIELPEGGGREQTATQRVPAFNAVLSGSHCEVPS